MNETLSLLGNDAVLIGRLLATSLRRCCLDAQNRHTPPFNLSFGFIKAEKFKTSRVTEQMKKDPAPCGVTHTLYNTSFRTTQRLVITVYVDVGCSHQPEYSEQPC